MITLNGIVELLSGHGDLRKFQFMVMKSLSLTVTNATEYSGKKFACCTGSALKPTRWRFLGNATLRNSASVTALITQIGRYPLSESYLRVGRTLRRQWLNAL